MEVSGQVAIFLLSHLSLRLSMAFLLALVLVISNATSKLLPVYTDLLSPRLPTFGGWCSIALSKEHNNWGPVQDPRLWTNLSLQIPPTASAVQLSARPLDGNMGENVGGYLAKVMYHEVDPSNCILYISVMWWADPWILYIGWEGVKVTRTTKCKRILESNLSFSRSIGNDRSTHLSPAQQDSKDHSTEQ